MFSKNSSNFNHYYSSIPNGAKPVPLSNFIENKNNWLPPIVYRDQFQNASNLPLRNIYRCQKIKIPRIISFSSVSPKILLDPKQTALLIVCYFKDPENYTMTSFGPVLDPSLSVNEFKSQMTTNWIYFKDYLHSKLYTIIINGYNYSGRTIADQISKEAFIKKFINYMSDKTYIIGHGACLESIFYNIHLYLQKHQITTHNLDKILFVEAPKVGPIYIWPGCFKEMNHNNNCCSNCVYMNMCKAINKQIRENTLSALKTTNIQSNKFSIANKENNEDDHHGNITNDKIVSCKKNSLSSPEHTTNNEIVINDISENTDNTC